MANFHSDNMGPVWFPDLLYIRKEYCDALGKIVVRVHCDGEVLDFCRWKHILQVVSWEYMNSTDAYVLTITEELWTLLLLKYGDKIHGLG